MTRRWLLRVLGVALMAPLAISLLTMTGADAAPTQTDDDPGLGGFELDARGNGVRVLYDIPGALPIGTLVDIGVPEAQARLTAGPVGSALSGLGYPGPVALGIESLLAQSGVELPFELPPYPLVVQANSSGPTEVRDTSTVPGSSMYARAEGGEAEAVSVAGTNTLDAVLSFAGVRTRSTTSVDDTADASTTVEISDVRVLGGLLRIDTITTELTATSDGETASSRGDTTLAGATLLGLPVEIGADGIFFTDPPEGEPSGPLAGLIGTVREAVDPLSSALDDLLDQVGSLNELLETAGITIRVAEPRATGHEAAAERVSAGLMIELSQELGATPLAQLFDLVPLIPGVPGLPVGPNDLIQILQSRQIASLSIGWAEVAASATPEVEVPPIETNIDSPVPAPNTPTTPADSSGTSSPTSGSNPAATGNGAGSSEVATGPASSSDPLALRGILGPGLIVLAAVGAFALSFATRKLPDWSMDSALLAGTDCDPDPEPPGEQP